MLLEEAYRFLYIILPIEDDGRSDAHHLPASAGVEFDIGQIIHHVLEYLVVQDLALGRDGGDAGV